MTLGTHIRKERKRLGITGREMARKVGISPAYMCDIELDRRLPPLATLKRIGKIIDIEYGCAHGPCRRCGKAWPKEPPKPTARCACDDRIEGEPQWCQVHRGPATVR